MTTREVKVAADASWDVSLWEAVLPPAVLQLREQLVRVDALGDPVFFAPFATFVPFFDPRGGPTVEADGKQPADDVSELPLPLGYESLCGEVSGSITWRRFCRIPTDGNVPHRQR